MKFTECYSWKMRKTNSILETEGYLYIFIDRTPPAHQPTDKDNYADRNFEPYDGSQDGE